MVYGLSHTGVYVKGRVLSLVINGLCAAREC